MVASLVVRLSKMSRHKASRVRELKREVLTVIARRKAGLPRARRVVYEAVVAGVALLGLSACATGPEALLSGQSGHEISAHTIANEMQALPYWIGADGAERSLSSSEVQSYADLAGSLGGLPASDVRLGAKIALSKAWDHGYGRWVLLNARLFVLWRILFELPRKAESEDEFIDIGLHAFHGGFFPNPAAEELNLQWPAVFDDGRLVAVEPFINFKGAYDGLDDFDRLLAKAAFRQ